MSNPALLSPPKWRWLNLRLEMTVEAIAVWASLFFAAVSNIAFWRAAHASGAFSGNAGILTATSLFLVIFALHAALLALVLNRWTAKPLLTVLFLVTASASFFASAYAVHLDPGMVRNVLRTDSSESIELLTPDWQVRSSSYGFRDDAYFLLKIRAAFPGLG
jgi:lipid A ethanolaminephosphotransferase